MIIIIKIGCLAPVRIVHPADYSYIPNLIHFTALKILFPPSETGLIDYNSHLTLPFKVPPIEWPKVLVAVSCVEQK